MKIVYLLGALILTACDSPSTATAPASTVGSTSTPAKVIGDSGPGAARPNPSNASADAGSAPLDAGDPGSVLGTHRGSDWAEWPMPSKAHPPSYTLNDAGTIVTDNVTGLVWPREPPFEQDGGVREVSLEGAVAYCGSLSLGGETDWRLPSTIELYSIINLDATYPSLGPPFTRDPAADRHPDTTGYQSLGDSWSTTIAGHQVITVDFDEARTGREHGKGAAVRCVRQSPTRASSEVTGREGDRSSIVADAADGGLPMSSRYELPSPKVVFDTKTKLAWERAGSTKERSYEAATKYCKTLGLDGGGWRVPEQKELMTLLDYSAIVPPKFVPLVPVGHAGTMHYSVMIDQRAFPGSHSEQYWSSTEAYSEAGGATHEWVVDFAQGTADSIPIPGNDAFVRCVRDTPAPPEPKTAAPGTSPKTP